MQINFNIEKLVPKFLLADRTGYALAKAIEKAFQYVAQAAEDGIAQIQDVDKMSETRLDEMAWEYNIPYDYVAPIEVKRKWIREAYVLSRSYGTKAGVEKYIRGYFDEAEVKEAAEYGGDPFHFTIDIKGDWSEQKQVWALNAINETKNVRSVFDRITFHLPDILAKRNLFVGTALYGKTTQNFEEYAEPEIDESDFLVDEEGNFLLDERMIGLTD